MPIYMDLHIVPGVKAKDAAEAHRMDILIEEEHDCKCMTYWIDEARGHVFCLIDAPDKQAVEAMHDKAHGLVPHRIIEVQTSLVESFLGRVQDPVHSAVTENGLPLISDPTFRILLLVRIDDAPLLVHRMGKDKAIELIRVFNQLVRRQLALQGGARRNIPEMVLLFHLRRQEKHWPVPCLFSGKWKYTITILPVYGWP